MSAYIKCLKGGALIGALLITIFPVFAYDQNNTHPALTDEIVDFYNLNFPNKKLTNQEKQWLIQGAKEEDIGERPLFHFYDPVYNRGVAHFSSKDWALKTSAQANYYNGQLVGFAAISGGDSANDFSYGRALDDYVKGDTQRAFIAFGHTLHLLEDAGVPDHTRNDAHPAFIHGQESPYEHEMAKWNPNNFQIARKLFLTREKPVVLGNMVDYFDKIANYSNNNFFSKDTISNKSYNYPDVNRVKKILTNNKERLFIAGKDKNGKDFPLAFLKIEKNGNSFKVGKPSLLDPDIGTSVLDGYWERLSKEVVLNGAGALNLFLIEAEKAKMEYASRSPEKQSWFARLFGLIGISNTSNITMFNIVSPQGVDNSNDGDRMVTPTSTVTNPSVSPSTLVTKTPDTNVTMMSPILSPLKTPVTIITKTSILTPDTKTIFVSSIGGGSPSTLNPTPIPLLTPLPLVTPTPLPSPILSPTLTPPTITLTPTPTPEPTEKININTGSKEQLMTLWGIGEVKANAIIEYRTTNGLFKKIENIVDVSGIGPATFEKIKDNITVGDVALKPQAITDLVAGHHSPTITATWSAPDSGGLNRASLSYDLRYSIINFPDSDTWSTASQIASSSLPSVGEKGAPQSASFDVAYEYGQTLHFALKTGLSDVSNIAEVNFPTAISSNSWAMLGKDQYHSSFEANLAGPDVGATKSWEFNAMDMNTAGQPVVSADGNIYFGATDGLSHKLIKLNKNGVKQWEYATNVSIGTPAVLSDETIYFGRIGAGGSLAFTALNSNGTKKWDYDDASTVKTVTVSEKGEPHFTYQSGAQDKLIVLKSDGSVKTLISSSGLNGFTPIILDDGAIITTKRISGNQFFNAYSSGGTQLWREELFYTGANGSIQSNPSYDQTTGNIYSAMGYDGGSSFGFRMFVISSDGSVLNTTMIDPASYGSAATMVSITPTKLLVGLDYSWLNPASGSKLFSLNKSDLTIDWSFQADGKINQQVAVDKDGNAYFSTQSGHVYSVDVDGHERWHISSGVDSDISPVLLENGIIWGYGNILTSIGVKV